MEYIFLLAILIFSIVIHEVAHGTVAYSLGDPTAKYAGRLTLNPMKHLDPMGSFFIPMFLVLMRSPILLGWAKPVPVNPYNFKDQKYGQFKVALAGPLSNLIIAVLFGLGARLIPLDLATKNIALQGGAFDFLSQIFFFFFMIVFINTLLAMFNLIPIPPLDGSHILFTIFPKIEQKINEKIMSVGFFFLPIVFLIFLFIFPYLRVLVFSITRFFIGI